jgi:hypothetical protein
MATGWAFARFAGLNDLDSSCKLPWRVARIRVPLSGANAVQYGSNPARYRMPNTFERTRIAVLHQVAADR